MNAQILNRRKPIFGKEKDDKKLTLEQIKTFYTEPDIEKVIALFLQSGSLVGVSICLGRSEKKC